MSINNPSNEQIEYVFKIYWKKTRGGKRRKNRKH